MQYLYGDELLVNPTTTRTKYADNKYSEITAVYDSKYGGVISSTDASGNTTDYKYDECGRIQEIRYPEYNSDNSYKYVRENYTYSRYSRFNNTEYFNVVKNTYKSSTASGYGTIVSSVSEKYDDYGNLVYRKTDAREEEYLYDNCNRVVGYKNYDDLMSGQCSYDNLNRVETVTDALGNINHVLYKLLKKEFYFTKSGSTAKENQVKQYYDMFGNIVKTENYSRGINSNPDTNLFTYDLAGNVLTATDGNGNITVFEYDNIGNNIKTILADGTIQENKFTKWGTSGKVSVKDGEKTTSVNNVYADDRGLSTSNYSTGIAIDTKPWYNSYDANGYPVKCIAPNGNERLFTYDECGNIASIQNGSQSEEIFYNFDGQISKHNKYINGRLEHSINYGYDNLERLTSKTIGSNITKYAYDNLGNLTSVTSPSGFARTYSYDRAERLVQLDFDGKTVSYDYNADGTVKKITYPNGITTEYVYDDAKRATSVTTKLGSSVKEQYSYTYDGNGNVLSVSGTKNISYTYDNLNRLKSYTENGVTTVYTYDKRNNLISETCGSNVKTYEYSGDNRLSKTIENDVETVYEYDLNGNLIRRGNDEFAYDEDNKLVYSNVNSVETTYKIGVEGLRSSKTTAGISTDYSIDEAGNVISEGSEEIIIGHRAVAKKIGSSYYYYLYNAHGDVTALTDSTGEILNNYSYDPWGRIISQTENVPNDIKYAGEYQDSETGLIYLRNRYYDPALGRFITEDPAKDGLNWYAYCGNNPINCVDPLGLYKLERDEDGEIYAIIEKGDSLSKIAIDQVNDASAWRKMKYDGNPNEIQIGQRINITGIYNQQYPAYNVVANVDKLKDKIRSSAKSLPFFGTPNSTRVLYNPDGTPKQVRTYGDDGKPQTDIDYNHGGTGHEFPHEHSWKNGKRQPGVPVPPKKVDSDKFENDIVSGAVTVIGVVAGVALFYYTGDPSIIYSTVR